MLICKRNLLLVLGALALVTFLPHGSGGVGGGSSLASFISGMSANSWKEIPNALLSSVTPTGAPPSIVNGGSGCRPGEIFQLGRGSLVAGVWTTPASIQVTTISGSGSTGPAQSIRIVNPGNYTVLPTGNIAQGATNGTCSGVVLSMRGTVATNMQPIAFLLDGGTGCQVGDVLTMVGGTGTSIQITVARVNRTDGQVQTFTYASTGNYSVLPTGNGAGQITFTGGHCTTEPKVTLATGLTYPMTTSANYNFAFPAIGSSSLAVGLVNAWTGMGVDEANWDFYILGGGHGDYGGNEMYVFHALSMKWERLTNPDPIRGTSYPQSSSNGPIVSGAQYINPVPIATADGSSTTYNWTYPNPYAGIKNHYSSAPLNAGYTYSGYYGGNVLVNGSDLSGLTTITGSIDGSATSITVASAASFPSSGTFYATIWTPDPGNIPTRSADYGEMVQITAGAGTTKWTMVRSVDGGRSASHAAGSYIQCWFCGATVQSMFNQSTGALAITFNSAPPNGANIATYQVGLKADNLIPGAMHNYAGTAWCPATLCTPSGELFYCPYWSGGVGSGGGADVDQVWCWAWSKSSGTWRLLGPPPWNAILMGTVLASPHGKMLIGFANTAAWYHVLTDTYGTTASISPQVANMTVTNVDDNFWINAGFCDGGIYRMGQNGGSDPPANAILVVKQTTNCGQYPNLATEPDANVNIGDWISSISVSGMTVTSTGTFTKKMATIGEYIALGDADGNQSNGSPQQITPGWYTITGFTNSTQVTVSPNPNCSGTCNSVSGRADGMGPMTWDPTLFGGKGGLVFGQFFGGPHLYELDISNLTSFVKITPSTLTGAPAPWGQYVDGSKFKYIPAPYDVYFLYGNFYHGPYIYHK